MNFIQDTEICVHSFSVWTAHEKGHQVMSGLVIINILLLELGRK